MQVQNIKTEIIKPYWRNGRDNTKTIEALKKSILDFGFNQPLVLDKKYTIIAGHARYKAMLELGMEEIPSLVVDMEPAKVKKYRIADNKTHELTSWVHTELMAELRELSDWQDLELYFPNVNVQGWLQESVGQTINDVSAEQIEKRQDFREGVYEESVQEYENNEVLVICPHCTEEFYVGRKEVLKRMDYPQYKKQ